MKRFYQFLATLFAGLALSVVSVSADSSSVCNIYNTGTDSFNECETNVDNNVTISCKNDIYVVNDNNQSSASGPAEVTDNSTSGNASSGNASNNNGTVQTIGSSCAPIQTAATTPTPAGGQGAAAPAAATPAPAPVKAVASLPETGNNTGLNTASDIGIGAAALTVVSTLSLAVYRRLALR